MDKRKNKKVKRTPRKTVFGIKLPPIEPEGSGDIKTIIDVDPEFFSMVGGRPIRPNTSYHAYKQNIRDVTVKRTLLGFVRDEILRIDRELELERKIYEKTSNDFEDYKESFDKFLADDNNKTIAIMQKSDALDKELANQTEEQKQANYELASIKSKLQYIDESLLILISFENFLHKAAPVLWQKSENVKLDVQHEEIVAMDNDIFQPIDKAEVRAKLDQLAPPRLYFEKPKQLLIIFDLLEKQNLNYLLVTEELTLQKNKFLKALDTFKDVMRNELSFIQQKMNETEDIIRWNENREEELKELFFRILEQKLKYLISSETALQIYNYVEFAYEQLIATNETKLSSYEMTQALESEYNNILLDLSAFDLDMLKKIEKETYENSEKEIRQAKEASKMLKDVDKLNKRLKSSFEPSRKKIE